MKHVFLLLAFSSFMACSSSDLCDDGIKNQDETDIDCGGACGPCPNCTDGIKNFEEAGVDCGGNCTPCGDAWEVIPFSGNPRQEHVFFINSEVGYLLNNLFTTYRVKRTRDGGNTWTDFDTPMSGINTGNQSVIEFAFISENRGYALEKIDNGVSDFRLFITSDGGESWIPTFESIQSQIFDIEFVNGNIGYLIKSQVSSDSHSAVYKTLDGGLSWNLHYKVPIDDNRPYAPNAISFINANQGFMTSIYLTYETVDGGMTWIKKEETLMESQANSLYMLDNRVGYVYGIKDGMNFDFYRTEDGGASWTSTDLAESPFVPNPVQFIPFFKDANTGYIAFQFGSFFDYGMIKTDNGGRSWQTYGSLPFYEGQQKADFHRCAVSLDDSYMYCLEQNRGVIFRAPFE